MILALASVASLWLIVASPQQRVSPAVQPTIPPTTIPSTASPSSGEDAQAAATQRTRVDAGRRVQPAEVGVALPSDTITVTLPEASAELLDPRDRSGRMILFFRARDSRAIGDPSDGPFFEDPQPVGSIQVDSVVPGVPIEVGSTAVWWPGGTELLAGDYEVQAILDVNRSDRGHMAPGNLRSGVVTINFARDHADEVRLELTQKIPPLVLPETKGIAWIDLPSALLSAAANRPVGHKAAVIFPAGYHDIRAKRRVWPTVYMVPGFGGRYTEAIALAPTLGNPALGEFWPQAVYVILDPESSLGHHGFVDSPLNGPRGTALVRELIPYIEDRYRVLREPSARIVTGHSSGGWASVWLALTHPEIFGAAFASSPDPLDFGAFQMSDLYRDLNLYSDADGSDRPSFRQDIGPKHDLVPMRVRDEVSVEYAMAPDGTSGQQWDAWAASFSPVATGALSARRLCDPHTGVIDPVTVEGWSRYDIARRMRADWNGLGRLFVERVRVIVGERDSFYLERAALRLRDSIDAHIRAETSAGREFPSGPGYIEIVPGATHASVFRPAQIRFNREIRAFFQGAGHHD